MNTDCKSEDISILPEAKFFNLKKKKSPIRVCAKAL